MPTHELCARERFVGSKSPIPEISRYNGPMEKKKEEPKVLWVQTNTGLAAQQALSDQAKRAKIARRTPIKKEAAADE